MRFESVRSAWARAVVVLALVACTAVSAALAQGVTSASVSGRILDESGNPIDGALVTATNVATGQRYQGRSRAAGLFNIENVVPGRYVFEGRALGFRPSRSEPLRLVLGQVAEVELRLSASAVELEALVVQTGESNPLTGSARTGQAASVSDTAIIRLPNLSRNFVDFIQSVPSVVGTSVAGLNNRFNNIQIDGAVNNDLFGLASSGTPGGQANARPMSVEAVKEMQILIAPFDVRQGGFTGGIINAITRSGTNEFRGTLFGYYTSQDFQSTYRDSTGFLYKPAPTSRAQYGFSVGGPIIRDRLHFFSVVDLSRQSSPFTSVGAILADTTGGADSVGVGIRLGTAQAVSDILKNTYGYNVGDAFAPTQKNPDSNILVKLSGALGNSTHFDLSHNSVRASTDNLSHQPGTANNGYQLSASGYQIQNKTNSTRLNVNTTFATRFTNELILGYSTVRDHRVLPNKIPRVVVNGDRCLGQNINDTLLTGETGTAACTTILAAGAERSSMANFLDQNILEISDNLTFPVGSHLFTLGTHNEFFSFDNLFLQNAYGTYWFKDVASLQAGTPYQYQIALLLRPNGGEAKFKVNQIGFYGQDRWTPVPHLTLTAGVRYDKPSFGGVDTLPNHPSYNARLDSIFYVARGGTPASFVRDSSTGGINTGKLSLAGLWAPRFGFNYDIGGKGTTVVRGGVGVFTGRPAYVWVSNAFGNTGLEQATLTCNGRNGTTKTDTVPGFTLDINNLPQGCNSAGTASNLNPPASNVVYYDPNFRFPQTLRFAFGADHTLPFGIVGTFDFLFTKYINNYYITDSNLRGPVGRATGEENRVMYGTIAANGSVTAARVSTAYLTVLEHSNRSGDRAWSTTFQLQKRFANGMEFGVGYTYSKAMDFISLGSSVALSNYQFTTLDGTLEHRNLRRSTFDRPHRFVASGAFSLPFQISAGITLTTQSGTPYGYVVSNDANADGITANDLVYVPLYSTDITLANPNDWNRLNAYINSEPCLNAQRGHVMTRNSCRNPWQTFLNARFTKLIPTMHGQSVELSWDIINVPRLLGQVLDNNWGVVNTTSGFENANLLQLSGYSAATGRGIYRLSLPQRRQVNVNASRWQMQMGARYSF